MDARRSPRPSGRRARSPRAAAGSRAVVDFQRRLERLDRRLAAAIDRSGFGGRTGGDVSGLVERLRGVLERGRVLDLLAKLDHIRASERNDEFGLDLEFEEMIAPLFEFLYRRWWRVKVEGIDNVPASGPALIVANHAGAMFPYDGAMLKAALRLDHPAARELRPLVENFVFRMPFVGSLMARVGGVRACPENAERLLYAGEVVGVFPEGVHGMEKKFRERYRLQRFGRGGFVSLGMKTGAPLVPVAIVGAEEIHPLLAKLEWPAKLLGLPYIPITPTFPWLGVLGLVPLPTKWTIRFGEAMDLRARYGEDGMGNPVLVDRATAEVRAAIQEMLDEMLRARRSVFF